MQSSKMLITASQLVNQSPLSTIGWFPLIRPKIKPLFLRGYIWGGRLTSQIKLMDMLKIVQETMFIPIAKNFLDQKLNIYHPEPCYYINML